MGEINIGVTIYCVTCAEPFMLGNEVGYRKTGVGFYCPRGHLQSFDSDNARLAKENESLKKQLADCREVKDRYWEYVEARDRKINALRGVITKLKAVHD